MSIFEKLKSFFAPTVPNPLPPLVQPDPKPVVEIETVLTVAPVYEADNGPLTNKQIEQVVAVEMPTQPFQVPVTNTDPTPPSWPFPSAPPVEGEKKETPAKKPSKKQQFSKKPTSTTKATVKPATPKKTTAKATVKTTTRTTKKNK